MQFPTVTGSNLQRKSLRLPEGFEGEWNLVFIAFQQWQQRQVDSWLSFAKQLEDSGRERLEICATNWVEEMNALRAGISQLDASQLIEVRYDQLLDNPLRELGRMLQFIDLERNTDFDDVIMRLGLSLRPAAWRTSMSDSELQTVSSIEYDWLKELKYE